MATFKLVTVLVALAVFTGTSSASVVTNSSTSLLTLINGIMNQVEQPGGIDLTTLHTDVVQLSTLASLLHDNLPDPDSSLAVALNDLLKAADVFLAIPQNSDAAALSGPFQNLTRPLLEVQGLLSENNGEGEGTFAARRKRVAAGSILCLCACSDCCCRCICGEI